MSSGDPPAWPPFEVAESKRLYDSDWVGLRRDMIQLPAGGLQEYHIVEIPDAIVVAPFLSDGSVVMIWQYRYPHGGSHWEVPAGRIHDGEDPAVAAARELREETGYEPGRIEPLPGFFPVNGISRHYAHAFVALDCRKVGEVQLDPAEQLEVRVIPRERARSMLHEGEIRDGFTALALHHAFARQG